MPNPTAVVKHKNKIIAEQLPIDALIKIMNQCALRGEKSSLIFDITEGAL